VKEKPIIKTAVILAAGLGSRLSGSYNEKPKGFLPLGGTPLIERSLKLLIEAGITSIIIGTGHLHEFYDELAASFKTGGNGDRGSNDAGGGAANEISVSGTNSDAGSCITNSGGGDNINCSIKCVINPDYAVTGSMATLYNLKGHIAEDFLLLESDLLYEKRGLYELVGDARENIILASGRTGSGDEVYIETGCEDRLVNMSKRAGELNKIDAELVGITKVSLYAYRLMCACYEKESAARPKLDYESALVSVSAESDIAVKKIDDYAWCEIDDENHLQRATNKVYPEISRRDGVYFRSEIKPRTIKVKRNILLNPGPATTSDTVKMAMVVPDICPREEEFDRLIKSVCRDLLKVVNAPEAQYAAVLFAGSGTAAMDAAINSAVPPGGRIAIIVNGAYGERMLKIAAAYKIPYIEINFGAGGRLDLDRIEKILSENAGALSTVAMVHHETTTGILNPAREVGRLCQKHNLTFILDSISSFAGVPIDAKEFNIDFMMSTSNKCIQGMAGAAFIICRKAALEALKNYEKRSFYLDLYDQYAYFEQKGETRFTPPVQVIYALRQALDEYFIEGGPARFARYESNWRTLRAGLLRLGFKLFHEETDESRILLTVYEPHCPNYDFKKMHDYLYSRGFTIYPGKISLSKTFRLANMGDINAADIDNFISALADYVEQNNI